MFEKCGNASTLSGQFSDRSSTHSAADHVRLVIIIDLQAEVARCGRDE